jgi:hypothetical protein
MRLAPRPPRPGSCSPSPHQKRPKRGGPALGAFLSLCSWRQSLSAPQPLTRHGVARQAAAEALDLLERARDDKLMREARALTQREGARAQQSLAQRAADVSDLAGAARAAWGRVRFPRHLRGG